MMKRVWDIVAQPYRDMPMEMLPLTTIALLPLVLFGLALLGGR